MEESLTMEKIKETYQERENIQIEIIKQLEIELEESKKKIFEQKQYIEESEVIINQTFSDLSNRLYKMSVNYMKTGKITDTDLSYLNLGSIGEMDEGKLLMLEIKKYKDMVKCPT